MIYYMCDVYERKGFLGQYFSVNFEVSPTLSRLF